MFQILGYEPNEITPSFSGFCERIDEADRARVEAMISRAIETTSSFEEEFTIVRPSGERRALLARGRILSDAEGRADRIHGAVLDVTDQRTVEAALKESEDRYRIIVEAAAEGIWTSNARGETTLINPRMAEMLGYEVEEIQELPLTAFLAGDGRELIRRVNARRRAGMVDRYEAELVRKDGSTFWVQVTANPMRSPTGEFMGALALISDISARKQTEDTLRAAYERESQALEDARAVDEMKNAFLAAVSHELRTPLTGVLGFASTLHDRRHSLDEADRDHMIERLLTNAQRLDKLLSDLLDLDRLGRGILEPKRRMVQVEELVHSVIEHGDHLTHRIKTDIEPGLSAFLDGPKVERIVENLINNAVRHTPLGTKIQVRAQSTDGGFVLSVDDEGPGIPDDEKEAIFEPFRTGSNSRPHSPGTGIGLSLVARFAELHGGRCWVADRPGGGSTFAVFLPHGQMNEQDSGAA
jgi:PAS domain S-box-containing protein